MVLIQFVPIIHLTHFGQKIFFRQNTQKSLPRIVGSPPVQKFLDFNPPLGLATGLQKFSKKKFFSQKFMFFGVFGVADHEYNIGFLKFSTLGPLGLKFPKIDFAKKTRFMGFSGVLITNMTFVF